jgi:hypothetical protein
VLWRADEHEELTDLPWAERAARGAIEAIARDAETVASDGFWPGHPLDDVGSEERFSSLYLGSAGMIWALRKLGATFDHSAALSSAIERYRAEPDFGPDAHPPSLLMGEAGLLVVAATIGSPVADRERLRRMVGENRAHPTWELMWGSPGTILAARACGLGAEWNESADLCGSVGTRRRTCGHRTYMGGPRRSWVQSRFTRKRTCGSTESGVS